MIEILQKGIYTSIQDGGRYDYQDFGVPISGPMDRHAFLMANHLLNNKSKAAAIECTFKGPKLRFHCKTHIVLTGADMQSKKNNKPIKNYKPIAVEEGDVIELGVAKKGCRAYIGVAGGLKTQKILGSRSQFKGITKEERITKKTLLPIGISEFIPPKGAVIHDPTNNYLNDILEAYPGPEYELLSKETQKSILEKSFYISEINNRMAYQLQEKIEHQLQPIWTAPILPGTVQCTPDGSLIILMADAQVTGGYPRIAQLTEVALSLLAQKSTQHQVRFKLLSETE